MPAAIRIDWTKYDHLLGTMRDHALAEQIKAAEQISISKFTVAERRKVLNIKAYFVSGREDRICPVCGRVFNVFKSLKRVTCSPECRHQHLHKAHLGKSNKWRSEKALRTIAQKKRDGVPRETIAAAAEVIKKHPLYGPFETNRMALWWELKSPEGKLYRFRNLSLWCRRHSQLFDTPTEKSVNISSGIRNLKRSQPGKLKRPVNGYKGWALVSWGE